MLALRPLTTAFGGNSGDAVDGGATESMTPHAPSSNYVGRNTVWGFRERVVKNLMFLNFARTMGADVHIVTQLVTSLLGLIVFPYEEIRRSGYVSFKQMSLAQLTSEGWPQWQFFTGSSSDLEDLVRHLRNAISHRRLVFSSDSRELEHVELRFHDQKHFNDPVDWEASINADQLLDFVLRFADLLATWEHDYS